MGKTFLFIFLFSILQAVPTNRQLTIELNSLQEQVQEQQQAITGLKGSQELTDKAIEQISNLVEVSNGSISNTLSVTNIVIALAALVVAFAAILLGGYISKMERKIQSMSDAVSSKEAEVKKLTTDINNDIYGIFERIRREDTKAYLKRLIEVPRDISNVCDILLARQLEVEDFYTLKKAYLNLKANKDDKKSFGLTGNYGLSYMGLFFQHFPGKALLDLDLREEIIGFIPLGVNAAFQNDIEKEVSEIGDVLSDKNVKDREEVLFKLRTAISRSQEYKNDERVLNLLKKSLNDNELWEKVEERMKEKKNG